MSEQNEELLTGKQGVEASQGYVPMPPTTPVAAESDISLESAVEQRTPTEAATVVDVGYNKANRDGSRSDERSPENQSITAERGAEDLQNWRRGLGEVAEALKDQQLAEELERLRSPLAKEIVEGRAETGAAFDKGYEAAQAAAARAAEQQPEQPQAQPVDADLSRVLQENPRLIEAIQQQRVQDWSQATQTVAAAEKWIHDSAAQALAGVMVNFPEFQNLSLQELPVALNLMQRQNPERHAQAVNYINAVHGILQQSAQVQQVQQQRAAAQYQHEWQRFSGDEDAKFITRNPQMADPAQASQITQKAIGYLRNIGFSDDDLGRSWHGQASWSPRDARVQQLIMDAYRYREAIAAVPNARVNKPMRVQRPGSPAERTVDAGYAERAAFKQLDGMKGTDAARLGAQLIAQRRAAR